MKKISFRNSKVSKVLSGKGFYIALCFSLVAVGAAGFVAYNQTVDKLSKTPSISVPDTSSKNDWDFNAVDKPVQDVPKDVQTAARPMVMPVNGETLNPFSNGALLKNPTTGIWTTHDGIDIKGEVGTPVKAITTGTVTKVAKDSVRGTYVIIDHSNGMEAYYCNLNDQPPVKEGDKVSAGTVVGAIGNSSESELSQPAHLHFGLKVNGKWVDPIPTINPGK